jgi:hypothetical protein
MVSLVIMLFFSDIFFNLQLYAENDGQINIINSKEFKNTLPHGVITPPPPKW